MICNIHTATTSKSADTRAQARVGPGLVTPLLMGKVPRMKLSLVHPCMSHRMSVEAEDRVRERSPRTFDAGQRVALHDLHPTASHKWWSAVVLQKLGALTYELNVEGHKRQAHVNHLQPWPSIDDMEDDQNLLPGQLQTLVPDQHRPCNSVTDERHGR